jgi:hypothetical protein
LAIGNWQSVIQFVSQRKSFLLRIDPAVLDAVQRWANDDLRSLNGQFEFLLRRALGEGGRAHNRGTDESHPTNSHDDPTHTPGA